MVNRYNVSITVISQKGNCAQGHKIGDRWVCDSRYTPGGICLSAFHTMYPILRVLGFGGSLPWRDEPDMNTTACPDPANPTVFELRRLRD